MAEDDKFTIRDMTTRKKSQVIKEILPQRGKEGTNHNLNICGSYYETILLLFGILSFCYCISP